MIAAAFLIVLAAYLACGLVFAMPFVFHGVKKIDPHAAHGSWGFRLLIIPGTRWLSGRCYCIGGGVGIHEPPR